MNKSFLRKLEDVVDVDVNVETVAPEEVQSMIDEAVQEEVELVEAASEVESTEAEVEELVEAAESLQVYQAVIKEYGLTPAVMAIMSGTHITPVLEHFNSGVMPSTESLSQYGDNDAEAKIVLVALEEAEKNIFQKAWDKLKELIAKIGSFFKGIISKIRERIAKSKKRKEWIKSFDDKAVEEALKADTTEYTLVDPRKLSTGFKWLQATVSKIYTNKLADQLESEHSDIDAVMSEIEKYADFTKLFPSNTGTLNQLGYKTKKDIIAVLDKQDDIIDLLSYIDSNWNKTISKLEEKAKNSKDTDVISKCTKRIQMLKACLQIVTKTLTEVCEKTVSVLSKTVKIPSKG